MATVGNISIVKAGWLYRETSLLHRWKKNWFVLYGDGILRYFDSPDSHTQDDAVILKVECTEINTQKLDSTPPEGKNSDSIFSLVLIKHGTWNLCAENADDMRAWTMTLNDLRHGGPLYSSQQAAVSYPPAPGYFPPAPVHYPSQTVMYTNPSVYPMPQTVIYTGDPLFSHHHYGRRYHHGGLFYPYGTLSLGSSMASPGAIISPPGGVAHPSYTTRYL